MTGGCVEFRNVNKKTEGSHAQMREQLKYEEPDLENINRRYFDDYQAATRFANSLFDSGKHFAKVKKG